MNILLGVSGGIACYKAVSLVRLLKKEGHDVRVVMTDAACKLVTPYTFQTVSANPVALSLFDPAAVHEVEHIAWATWAQIAILAPATANTLGKLAAGIADNMLTTIFMALTCPIIAAPAMNSNMLANPAVQASIETLSSRGVQFIEPSCGVLACGTSGPGRMPEPEEIAAFLKKASPVGNLLEGKRVLITAGPTQEPLDPVRYLTNRSSGKMGYALARAAANQGATVTLIHGPVSLSPPTGCNSISVVTAEQMYAQVMQHAESQDIVICAAAVSDYRPSTYARQKLKKNEEELVVRLVRTRDILAALGEQKTFYLVGFAAETENLEANAKKKLHKKNLDLIIGNDVSDASIGFESDNNAVTLYWRNGENTQISFRSKDAVAQEILVQIAADLMQ